MGATAVVLVVVGGTVVGAGAVVLVVADGAATGTCVVVVVLVGVMLGVGVTDEGATVGLADERAAVGEREVVGADGDGVVEGDGAADGDRAADGARAAWRVDGWVTVAEVVGDPPPPAPAIPIISTAAPTTVATTGWLFAKRTGRTAMPTV